MTWRLFYSYARQDAELRDRLGAHLAPLVHKKKISEWDEREVAPGDDWARTTSDRLNSAHLILLLLSPDYLASEYCFGPEIELALDRLKRGEVRILPILLRPCLWQESLFSELQVLPRNGAPIASSSSVDEALHAVATEIREIASEPPPRIKGSTRLHSGMKDTHPGLALVARQLRSYARIYERIRQRMTKSATRTGRMEQVFASMRTLAVAASPLLYDLASSPMPGDRLAAVAVLHSFAVEDLFPFLVRMVESDQSFIGYHAIVALRFAVGALEPHAYPELSRTLQEAESALDKNNVPQGADRRVVLTAAKNDLQSAQELFAGTSAE